MFLIVHLYDMNYKTYMYIHKILFKLLKLHAHFVLQIFLLNDYFTIMIGLNFVYVLMVITYSWLWSQPFPFFF